MPKRNEFTEVVLDMVEELKKLRAEAANVSGPGFMEEQLSARDLRNRLAKMGQAERAATRQKIGTEAMLKIVRGRR